MTATAPRRQLAVRLAVGAAILLLGDLGLQATQAAETAQAGNSASDHTASAQALYWPGSFAVAQVPATMGAQSTWTLAGPEKGTGYAVLGYHNGPTAGAACPTTPASYAYAASAPDATATVTDTTSDYVAGKNAAYEGSYSCFAIQQWYTPGVAQSAWTASTSPAWTSTNNPATVLPAGTYTSTATFPDGMFATSYSMANGNGVVASGDTLVINYSYSTNAPALGALALCTSVVNNTIYIGQNVTAACDTTGGSSVGTLTSSGGALSSTASKDGIYAMSGAWSNSNRTLTITILSLAGGKAASMTSGTWVFTPSQAPETGQVLVTQATGHPVCAAANTASAACLPSVTGRF